MLSVLTFIKTVAEILAGVVRKDDEMNGFSKLENVWPNCHCLKMTWSHT